MRFSSTGNEKARLLCLALLASGCARPRDPVVVASTCSPLTEYKSQAMACSFSLSNAEHDWLVVPDRDLGTEWNPGRLEGSSLNDAHACAGLSKPGAICYRISLAMGDVQVYWVTAHNAAGRYEFYGNTAPSGWLVPGSSTTSPADFSAMGNGGTRFDLGEAIRPFSGGLSRQQE